MKTVIKEWMKDPLACFQLCIMSVLKIIYLIVNARVLIVISNSLAEPNKITENISLLILLCIINTGLNVAIGFFRPLSVHHCFTTLNNKYSEKILYADYSMFTEKSCASIVTYSEAIWKITNVGINTVLMLQNIASLCITIFNMWLIGKELVIPVILIYLFGGFIMRYFFKLYTTIDKESDKIKRVRNQEIEETINGFAEVRTFFTQKHHMDSIREKNNKIYKGRIKRSKINALLSFSIDGVDTAGTICVILFVLSKLSAGTMEQAVGMSLVMFVWRLVEPMVDIFDYLDNVSENLSMMEGYRDIIEYVNKVNDDGRINLSSFEKDITIRNMSFNYPESSESVLNNINMTIKKGKKIGICGLSGGGKTTLFKLLSKFYVPSSGSIEIDGININDITDESLRNKLSIVHQDNHIFSGSIYENIIYGNFNSSEYEVIEACKKANIYDFIVSLPEKFNTVVGPRGLKLSGGQKQRIAIARIFLSNKDIILLDEATSALDNESESIIQESFKYLEGKTVITIAHRLSTIKECDEIYVLDNHKIAEHGSHDELMKLDGIYKSLNK